MKPETMPDRYTAVHQAQTRAPSAYDDALGDALEAAFERGIHDLPGLVAALNAASVMAPDGSPWTEAEFAAIMRRLADSH